MNQAIRASALLVLAGACWKSGGIVMEAQAGASREGALPPAGETVGPAAERSAGFEIRPVEFVATASEEWTLPTKAKFKITLLART
jgi:hypothetical protein